MRPFAAAATAYLQGQTVAALNVVASPQQMQAQTLQRDMLPLLQEAARELRGLL